MAQVHITEDHNEVLYHIYRAIGSKIIPFDGNVLIHLDSHPDLLIPDLEADQVFDKSLLFSSISIENWIAPALYAGHIDTVVWLKKYWASQISDGTYTFTVGKLSSTGQIRCSCPEPYFLGEALYARDEALEQSKQIRLLVCTVEAGRLGSVSQRIRDLLTPADPAVVLDVDLDYFSTGNPFVDLYTSRQWEILETLYRLEASPGADPAQTVEARSRQLEWLKATLIREWTTPSTITSDTDSRIQLVQELLAAEREKSQPADAALLHEHGCTFDTTPLPHHVSSADEIDEYTREFEELMLQLDLRPKIITVARSSVDDYCPPSQVDYIQEKVISSIKTLYKGSRVHAHYLS